MTAHKGNDMTDNRRVLPDAPTADEAVSIPADENGSGHPDREKKRFLTGQKALLSPSRGVIWQGLVRLFEKLYCHIGHSFGGRVMTSYRRDRTVLTSGESTSDAGAYRPLSPARSRVVEAANRSLLLRGTEALFSAFADAPLRALGIFLIVYGVLGILFQAFMTPLLREFTFDINRTVDFTILALLSVPFLISSRSLRAALYGSRFCRALLCGFLGVPEEDFNRRRNRVPFGVSVAVAVLAALGSTAASLWLHPLTIPLALPVMALVGLVLCYPEVGAVLSTLCLPFTWIGESTLTFTALLILLTWVGYGFAILRLRRSFRFGRLDAAYAVMMLVVLLGGVSSTGFTVEALTQSLIATVLLSDYYLFANLMNTRAYIKRCLIGIGISVFFMTLLCYVRMIPAGVFGWLDDSPGFREILGGIHSATDFLSGLWADNFELFLILMLPWQYALLLRCRRLGQVFAMLVFLALNLWAVSASGSVMAWISVLIGFALFFVLYSHRAPAVGIVLLPVAVSAGFVYSAFRPLDGILTSVLAVLSETTVLRTRLWSGVWRMILDHPLGIGLSEAAFHATYPMYADPGLYEASASGSLYLDILVAFGWPGAVVMVCTVFLFVQKCMTVLHRTDDRRDRALLLGGLVSFASLMILGFARSFAVIPKPAFIIALSVGLCSAFANILFREHDVLASVPADSGERAERFYHSGR